MTKKKEKTANKASILIEKVFVFLKEVFLQIKKISWPSFGESLRYTMIVLLISIITAIFLGGVDFGITTLLNRFILR